LSSRGAVRNAPPAINGQEHLPPQRFAPGQTVRLRFAHISEDDVKTVRLLQAGKEVQWRARAKDGADLHGAAASRFVTTMVLLLALLGAVLLVL